MEAHAILRDSQPKNLGKVMNILAESEAETRP